MIRALAVVLLSSTIADPACADWEYMHWGMTAQQVIEASQGAAHAMLPDRRYRDDADHYEITVEAKARSPLQGNVGFQFNLPGGGLQCVIINAAGDDADMDDADMDDADILLTDLLRRYGAAISESSFGPLRTLRWSTPDRVELSMNNAPKAAVVSRCAPGKS